MQAWVVITVAAAFLQNIRSTLQKHLKKVMGTTGATFVRFGYGVPFAIMFLLVLNIAFGYEIPRPNAAFAFWVVIAAVGQIVAQALLVHLFSFRNFAVGTAYSRTEPAQAAIFGLLFLGELVTPGALIAILITVFGVMLISVAHQPMSLRNLAASLVSRTSLIGLASGTAFGIAAVGYRAASLALGYPNFMMQAAMTLVCAITLQTVVLLIWMKLREPAEIGRVRAAWKTGLAVGFVGATASFGWFMAMTLQQAAIVKALAQIEILFTFASSVFFFRERINRLETIGCVLIALGIVVLVIYR
ncbi:MAG: EamA family transporter [Flavobacteriaceae bacterium]